MLPHSHCNFPAPCTSSLTPGTGKKRRTSVTWWPIRLPRNRWRRDPQEGEGEGEGRGSSTCREGLCCASPNSKTSNRFEYDVGKIVILYCRGKVAVIVMVTLPPLQQSPSRRQIRSLPPLPRPPPPPPPPRGSLDCASLLRRSSSHPAFAAVQRRDRCYT